MTTASAISTLDVRRGESNPPDGLGKVADRAASPWSPRIARFMRRIEVSANGCWTWTGPLDDAGYARTSIGCERMGVHEASYRLFIGDIGAGLELDHLCRVRHCCNPAHLEAVTREENMRRMRHPWPTEPSSPLTHCRNGHEYTDDNTYVRGDAAKYCRECARIGNAVRRANRKAASATTSPESLDVVVETICADIRNRARFGRRLPLSIPSSPARVDELIGAAIGLVRGGR